MAGDAYKKVQTGQPLAIPAETFNAFVDAARDHKSRRQSIEQQSQPGVRQTGFLLVKNQSGADRRRFDVLGLDAPLITPTDNPDSFQNETALVGSVPDKDQHTGRYGILLEPVAQGRIGPACVAGVCVVRVDVKDDCHWFAEIKDGEAGRLQSGKEGSATILWKEEGTGEKWAVVRIGETETGKACTTTTPCPEAQGFCTFEARYVAGSSTETEWVAVESGCAEEALCQEPATAPTTEQADAGEWQRTCCQTTTTTTSTTPAPCSGDCHWTWNNAAQSWSLTSSTCAGGCQCAPPQYCGSEGCETTRTDCFPGGAPEPVDCGGTTTTCAGTTTTQSPECSGCTYYYRFGQWHLVEDNCNDPDCFCCGAPTGPGNECDVETVIGCCSPPPPPPPPVVGAAAPGPGNRPRDVGCIFLGAVSPARTGVPAIARRPVSRAITATTGPGPVAFPPPRPRPPVKPPRSHLASRRPQPPRPTRIFARGTAAGAGTGPDGTWPPRPARGSFTLKLNGEDNVIVDLASVGSGQVEKHVLAMYWLWNDGSQDRSGIQLVRFRVQRLGVQVFPALP